MNLVRKISERKKKWKGHDADARPISIVRKWSCRRRCRTCQDQKQHGCLNATNNNSSIAKECNNDKSFNGS